MAASRKPTSIFPDLPRDNKIANPDGTLTDSWKTFFDQLVLALQTNFKSEGIVIPPLTATQIASLTGTASNNNIVYDSTNNVFKGNENGTWKTFTLT